MSAKKVFSVYVWNSTSTAFVPHSSHASGIRHPNVLSAAGRLANEIVGAGTKLIGLSSLNPKNRNQKVALYLLRRGEVLEKLGEVDNIDSSAVATALDAIRREVLVPRGQRAKQAVQRARTKLSAVRRLSTPPPRGKGKGKGKGKGAASASEVKAALVPAPSTRLTFPKPIMTGRQRKASPARRFSSAAAAPRKAPASPKSPRSPVASPSAKAAVVRGGRKQAIRSTERRSVRRWERLLFGRREVQDEDVNFDSQMTLADYFALNRDAASKAGQPMKWKATLDGGTWSLARTAVIAAGHAPPSPVRGVTAQQQAKRRRRQSMGRKPKYL